MRILLQTYLRLTLVGALLFALAGCEPSVPDGLIRVKNDSEDRTYNVVEVSGSGFYFSLQPGESSLLPRGTREISFSRQYKDFSRAYRVECPGELTKGITIKLIDVHLNRIAGGCQMVWSNM